MYMIDLNGSVIGGAAENSHFLAVDLYLHNPDPYQSYLKEVQNLLQRISSSVPILKDVALEW